jgi:hypothetical protein
MKRILGWSLVALTLPLCIVGELIAPSLQLSALGVCILGTVLTEKREGRE